MLIEKVSPNGLICLLTNWPILNDHAENCPIWVNLMAVLYSPEPPLKLYTLDSRTTSATRSVRGSVSSLIYYWRTVVHKLFQRVQTQRRFWRVASSFKARLKSRRKRGPTCWIEDPYAKTYEYLTRNTTQSHDPAQVPAPICLHVYSRPC